MSAQPSRQAAYVVAGGDANESGSLDDVAGDLEVRVAVCIVREMSSARSTSPLQSRVREHWARRVSPLPLTRPPRIGVRAVGHHALRVVVFHEEELWPKDACQWPLVEARRRSFRGRACRFSTRRAGDQVTITMVIFRYIPFFSPYKIPPKKFMFLNS